MMQNSGLPSATPATERWGQLAGITGTGAALAPWPIPEEAVIEGSPSAPGRILACDRRAVAGLWQCEPDRIEFVVEGHSPA
jgi:hypothetical protein